MQVISFDTSEDIPKVDAIVRGPRDFHRIRLVFDTGSELTQLDTDMVESLGYSAATGERALRTRGAGGEGVEEYSVRLENLIVLGKEMRLLEIGAFDFTHYSDYGIHGLLGWDVIKRLHIETEGPAGILRVF